MSIENAGVQELLESMILLDCRLGDHPSIACGVYLQQKEEEFKCVAATGFYAPHSIGNRLLPFAGFIKNFLKEARHFAGSHRSDSCGRTEMLGAFPSRFGDLKDKYHGCVYIFLSDDLGDSKKSRRTELHRIGQRLGGPPIHLAIEYFIKAKLGGLKRNSYLTHAFGKYLQRCRVSGGFLVSDIAQKIQVNCALVEKIEAGSALLEAEQITAALALFGHLSTNPTIVHAVEFDQRLLTLLLDDPANLLSLSPEQFEQFIANRLDRMGFAVQLTGSTYKRDGGIDLIAVPKLRTVTPFLLAGQVKHHDSWKKTDRVAVERLLSWRNGIFNLGLLVTNTGFTRDALWTAALDQNRGFLRLRDFDDLKRWIQGNFWDKGEWREIPDKLSIAPGISVEIPVRFKF